MEPTLNTLATSAEELSQKAPQEAAQMQGQVAALKKFSDDIQELSSLENSLTEFYELSEINVGTFCENVMDKVKEYIKQDVTSSVNAPKLQVKTNKEQLERILLYLLKNAAFYTDQGRISLEFKKRGAHTHQSSLRIQELEFRQSNRKISSSLSRKWKTSLQEMG